MVAGGGLRFAIDPWCNRGRGRDCADLCNRMWCAKKVRLYIRISERVWREGMGSQVKSYCRQLSASATVEGRPRRRQ